MADIKTENQKEKAQVAKPPEEKTAIPLAISKEMDEIMRRLRLLEDRYSGVRKKSQFNEQNMLKDTKDIFEEINAMHVTITELKSEMEELSEKLEKLTDEVKGSVKKPDFNVLAKYIDFWQPLNFLTKEEAEKLLNEKK